MVAPTPASQPASSAPRHGSRSRLANGAAFQLSSLLLLVFLIAVCRSIGRLSPRLGILASVVAVLALLRTAVAAARWSALGQPTTALLKTAFFLQSVTIVVWSGILVASACLFAGMVVMLLGVAAERVLPLDGLGYVIGIISSGIIGTGAAAFAAALVAKALWPIPETFHPFRNWHPAVVKVDSP